jgi:long-chain fatty acid transport protein
MGAGAQIAVSATPRPHGAGLLALAAVLARLVVAGPPAARAAGFSLVDQGGRAIGTAYAAKRRAPRTRASSPSTRPASRARGHRDGARRHAIDLRVHYEDDGSTLNPAAGGGRLGGARDTDAGERGGTPAAFLVHQLSERWRVGLGVMVPFGFRTDYDPDWVGRYHAIESDLKMVEVSPAVAVKLPRNLSLGAALDVQYAHTRLTGALDTGSLCELNLQRLGAPPGTCGILGLRPEGADGFVRLKATDWALGWQAGVLWEPAPDTRVGLSYRSHVRHELEGTAEFILPPKAEILRQTGALRDTDARTELPLPEVVRLAAYHRLAPRWALLAGIAWTRWSRFDDLVVSFANAAQPPVVQPERWTDSFR